MFRLVMRPSSPVPLRNASSESAGILSVSDVGYSEEAGSGARTMLYSTANDAMPETASAKSAVAEDKKIIRNVSLTIKMGFAVHFPVLLSLGKTLDFSFCSR